MADTQAFHRKPFSHYIIGRRGKDGGLSYFHGRGVWRSDNSKDARQYGDYANARAVAERFAGKHRGEGFPVIRVDFDNGSGQ